MTVRNRFFALCLGALLARTARADKDTLITLGLGTTSMVGRCSGTVPGAPMSTVFGQDVNLRLRLLRVIALEASYAYASDHGRTDLNVAAPTFRIAGQLFFTTQKRVAPYFILGVGGTDIRDAVSLTGATTSYHAGLGLEVAISPHWLVDASWRLDMPGYRSASERDPRAFSDWQTFRGFYNFDTWQLGIGARYYL